MHSFAPEILLITILGLVVLSDAIATKLKIPSVFLLLIGSYIVYTNFKVLVPIDLKQHFDEVIIFGIPLIFMGDSLHLKFKDLKKHGWGIFYLAVISVALSITAGASLSFFNIFKGLSLGAYVSLFAINMATDAVSVQSVLSRFKGINHDIKVLIEGESLGNDATAVIAFFFVGMPWMLSGHINVGATSFNAIKVFLLSLLIGITIGFVFYMLMKLFSDRRGEFFAFVIQAYLAYVVAEKLHISGILTLITAIVATKAWIDLDILMAKDKNESFETKDDKEEADIIDDIADDIVDEVTQEHPLTSSEKKKEEEIVEDIIEDIIEDIEIDIELSSATAATKAKLRHRLRLHHIHATSEERLEYIYDMAKEFGYIATVLIFFVLAEMVDFKTLWSYRSEILTMFLITTVIRSISTAKFAFIGKSIEAIKPVGIEGWFILTFSGMKGALSIILVHMIPETFKYKELFEAVTVGVVTLSIFVYGLTLWSYFTYKNFKNK